MTATRTRPARRLSPVQLRQLRTELREQRGFRLGQIRELEAETAADPVDDAARSQITAALLHGARRALGEIDAALERAATGQYGLCTSCQQPITVERLEILPMAALCMRCQRRRQTRGSRDRRGAMR